MSARNMVRSLRDSGLLRPRNASDAALRTLVLALGALAFGAVAYIGASAALPLIGAQMQPKPITQSFAKPED
jgi:hypothetical protein